MRVRPEAAAGAAAVADHLSLLDARAHRRAEARLVRVAGRQRGRVLDAGEVAVAAGRRLRLHQHDLAVGRRADRRARGDADVDARVAGLPGARLAERRRDRPVDRPDEPARAAADRTGGERAAEARQLGLELALGLLEAGDVVFELVPAVARGVQQRGLLRTGALDGVLALDEADAHGRGPPPLGRGLGV